MELYIQIKDGQPFEHPIVNDNFCQAFPEIDVNNLPENFARFERIECPNNAGVYEIDVVSYQWVNGIVKDVWTVRPMTQEEKDAKIANTLKPFPSWIFNQSTCEYDAPVMYPDSGKRYYWDEETTSWIEFPLQETP